jgi:hypothetical protein
MHMTDDSKPIITDDSKSIIKEAARAVRVYNFVNKTVVYTAIFDDYDQLNDPESYDPSIDYVCFTSSLNIKSNKWRVIIVKALYRDPRRSARLFKLFPHLLFPKHDISVWVDGSCRICGDVKNFIYANISSKILFFSHPERNCAYEEAKVCLSKVKDDPDLIRAQIDAYRAKGYPSNHGLIASGIIVRLHNDSDIIDLMEAWFCEIDMYSARDQLSFNYCAWLTGSHFTLLRKNIFKNDVFHFVDHRKWVFYNKSGGAICDLRILVSRIYCKMASAIKALVA